MIDPRIERTRAAVLRAAVDLWVEGGPSAVTVDAIVDRSGVAKSTIYRHWSARDEIMVDVVRHSAPDISRPDPSTPFEPALRQIMAEVVDAFNDPEWTCILPALMMLKLHEPRLDDVETDLRHEQIEILADVIRLGSETGELVADTNVNRAAAHLFGPLLFAHLSGEISIDHGFGDEVVDRFIASHGAPQEP